MDPEAQLAMEWLLTSHNVGCARLSAIYQAFEDGTALPSIDLVAWENLMVALEWAVTEAIDGRVQWTKQRFTAEDVALIRRLRRLGSAALTGEGCSPEMQALTGRCLELLVGPGWRNTVREMARWDPAQFLEGA
ncbi:MAG: hypothetical protein QM820_54330 [Minicystis sp.]